MRHFLSDRKGNVAVLFALAVVPVIGGLGAAIDYSTANSYRTDMQKALDATALALSKIIPLPQAQLDAVGTQYFKANLGYHDLTDLKLIVTPEQGKVKLRASGNYTPKLANLFGATQFEVGAEAEAHWSMGKVEIALVLDNSGSMTDHGRMAYLKESAHDLLEVLETAAREPDDAKVAIVAFDQRVNVGTAHKDANWLRWDVWESSNGECEKSGYDSKNSCEATKVCSKPQYSSRNSCQNNGGTWRDAIWAPASHDDWTGCVEDRNKNNDVSDVAATSTATKYPAAQCKHEITYLYPGTVTAMQRLTNDWVTLGATIDSMQPAGYTNIAIGLAWGWHLLSPTDVATEGKAYNTPNLTKYIILMTDGDNTKNRFGDHSSTIDSRLSTACTNAKSAGIKIYTIRLVSGNASLLRGCASTTDMYYDVQDAGALSGVFSAIGTQIASLHLAK